MDKREKEPFKITKTAIRVADDVEFPAWLEKIKGFSQATVSANWWIGDLLVFGEDHFAEQVGQVINDLGLAEQTVANFRWVSRAITPSRRREELTWEHHRAVAKLEPKDQERWLARAIREKMSAATLKTSVKLKVQQEQDKQREEDGDDEEGRDDRYRVILANIGDAEMDVLEKVKVPAEPNAVIFVVVPADRVNDGAVLLEVWGFVQEMSMVIDTGKAEGKWWARVQHRIVLIGTRGNIQSPPAERLAPSIIRGRIPRNGTIPDELVSAIEDMFPNRFKKPIWCDLFATAEREGWATPLVEKEPVEV